MQHFGFIFVLIMSAPNEIQKFLNDFHAKMSVWNVVYRDDRGKNTQALFDLEITKAERNKTLATLKPADYSQGPLAEELHKGADMWVFGKLVKGKEVYIKITIGVYGAQVICISFHIAEHPMNYPYKSKE